MNRVFLIVLCFAHGAFSMDDSRKASQPKKWYIINDTEHDLRIRVRFGKNKKKAVIARARMVTDVESLTVNCETNKFPKKSYFMLNLNAIHKKFPIRVRLFNETTELREDVVKGKANDTCLINQNASCYALPIETKLMHHYFPLLHFIEKIDHFETKPYDQKIDEQAVKKIVAGFKCLGECTTKAYAQ